MTIAREKAKVLEKKMATQQMGPQVKVFSAHSVLYQLPSYSGHWLQRHSASWNATKSLKTKKRQWSTRTRTRCTDYTRSGVNFFKVDWKSNNINNLIIPHITPDPRRGGGVHNRRGDWYKWCLVYGEWHLPQYGFVVDKDIVSVRHSELWLQHHLTF